MLAKMILLTTTSRHALHFGEKKSFPAAQTRSLLESGTSVLARRLYVGQLCVFMWWFKLTF